MDNTFVIQEGEHSQQLLQHINLQGSHIQFTIKEPNQEGALPFLDTLVSLGPNNTLVTTVYRKPTHNDQHLHRGSNHFITAEISAFNTLAFRAKVVCTSQQALHKEMEYIKKALQACNFLLWSLNNPQNKLNHKHNIQNGQTTTGNQPNNTNNNGSHSTKISIVVPHINRLGERFKRTCKNFRIQVHFKGSNTIKIILMAPKDRDNKLKKKVGSFTGLNAHTLTVQRNTYGNQAELSGIG